MNKCTEKEWINKWRSKQTNHYGNRNIRHPTLSEMILPSAQPTSWRSGRKSPLSFTSTVSAMCLINLHGVFLPCEKPFKLNKRYKWFQCSSMICQQWFAPMLTRKGPFFDAQQPELQKKLLPKPAHCVSWCPKLTLTVRTKTSTTHAKDQKINWPMYIKNASGASSNIGNRIPTWLILMLMYLVAGFRFISNPISFTNRVAKAEVCFGARWNCMVLPHFDSLQVAEKKSDERIRIQGTHEEVTVLFSPSDSSLDTTSSIILLCIHLNIYIYTSLSTPSNMSYHIYSSWFNPSGMRKQLCGVLVKKCFSCINQVTPKPSSPDRQLHIRHPCIARGATSDVGTIKLWPGASCELGFLMNSSESERFLSDFRNTQPCHNLSQVLPTPHPPSPHNEGASPKKREKQRILWVVSCRPQIHETPSNTWTLTLAKVNKFPAPRFNANIPLGNHPFNGLTGSSKRLRSTNSHLTLGWMVGLPVLLERKV